ncbi:acyl-CoA dehydrogenase family protein [Sphingomonas profundi]|uniref:acyl-CoA dehydrogenase family protein n=1 Tax=Alterirhizorhabdus profundi TaxID=2681549 RepID=UPI0012E86498|nr:acyl-CoA dehydrogenase family protein [Sphingomonas profundi]
MDLLLTEAQQAFRAEVRAFLAAELTPALREGQQRSAGVYPEPEISGAWQRTLHCKGWVAPTWPVEHGGTGWNAIERFIFECECALAGAPIVYPIGIRLAGPVILAYGTAEQKATWLPRILSGEDYWCQGFSEPGAGSDLASLATRAVREGDDYIVNGSKIWTTHAHHANRMFALVRTADTPKRQDGISFLVLDLDTPGIEVRPIRSIGGDHDVNQVFFTDVRVPAAHRIGAEGQGWEQAKYLLEFERGTGLFSSRLRSSMKRLEDATAASRPFADPHLARRLAEVAIEIDTFEMLELMTLGTLAPGANPGPVSSVLKLRASRLKQTVSALGVEALGAEALRWEGHADPLADVLVPDHLNARAATIFGGASEIQLGIIAKSIGGL